MQKSDNIFLKWYYVALILCVMGTLLADLCLCLNYQEVKGYVKTEGEITNVEAYRVVNNNSQGHPYGGRVIEFTYVVDDITYKAEQRTFNVFVNAGDSVTIRYEMNNPANIVNTFTIEVICCIVLFLGIFEIVLMLKIIKYYLVSLKTQN